MNGRGVRTHSEKLDCRGTFTDKITKPCLLLISSNPRLGRSSTVQVHCYRPTLPGLFDIRILDHRPYTFLRDFSLARRIAHVSSYVLHASERHEPGFEQRGRFTVSESTYPHTN
jgi:hypothetical protein